MLEDIQMWARTYDCMRKECQDGQLGSVNEISRNSTIFEDANHLETSVALLVKLVTGLLQRFIWCSGTL